jgi:hypothetical protein
MINLLNIRKVKESKKIDKWCCKCNKILNMIDQKQMKLVIVEIIRMENIQYMQK